MTLPSDRLTIFHYHVSPGGVTEVIASSVEAILRRLPQIESVTIVCGDRDNTETLAIPLASAAKEHGKSFGIDIVPEIGYLDMHAPPDPRLAEAVNSALSRYRGSTWWVHNYQIGKNPVFTNTLLGAILEESDQTVVLHIHDFPERARFDNLSFLNRHLTHAPYPIRPNVRYAVINARDRSLLMKVGIPGSHVFLLNNPVKTSLPDRSSAHLTKRSLEAAFGGEFPRFRPERPLIMYPVRTIRRKNVLELGLIAALDPAEPSLVVTLPGISQLERPYSDIVERGFRERVIPGLWGIGNRLVDTGTNFSSLIAAADMLGSSSVQEGFGYLYVDAGQLGIPLIARRLEVLDGIMDVFDPVRCRFYDSLTVPVGRRIMTSCSDAYHARIRDLAGFLDATTVSRLEAEIDGMFDGEAAEFSFLDVENQYGILRRVREDRIFGEEIVANNPDIFNALGHLHRQPLLDGIGTLDPRFSLEGVAQGIGEILSSFGGPSRSDRDFEPRIQRRLIDSFARIENLRLLYG